MFSLVCMNTCWLWPPADMKTCWAPPYGPEISIAYTPLLTRTPLHPLAAMKPSVASTPLLTWGPPLTASSSEDLLSIPSLVMKPSVASTYCWYEELHCLHPLLTWWPLLTVPSCWYEDLICQLSLQPWPHTPGNNTSHCTFWCQGTILPINPMYHEMPTVEVYAPVCGMPGIH